MGLVNHTFMGLVNHTFMGLVNYMFMGLVNHTFTLVSMFLNIMYLMDMKCINHGLVVHI